MEYYCPECGGTCKCWYDKHEMLVMYTCMSCFWEDEDYLYEN